MREEEGWEGMGVVERGGGVVGGVEGEGRGRGRGSRGLSGTESDAPCPATPGKGGGGEREWKGREGAAGGSLELNPMHLVRLPQGREGEGIERSSGGFV